MTIQSNHPSKARRPDTLVVRKESKKTFVIDVAASGDQKVGEKERR